MFFCFQGTIQMDTSQTIPLTKQGHSFFVPPPHCEKRRVPRGWLPHFSWTGSLSWSSTTAPWWCDASRGCLWRLGACTSEGCASTVAATHGGFLWGKRWKDEESKCDRGFGFVIRKWLCVYVSLIQYMYCTYIDILPSFFRRMKWSIKRKSGLGAFHQPVSAFHGNGCPEVGSCSQNFHGFLLYFSSIISPKKSSSFFSQ